jgi:uncharacterized protein YutD
MDRIYHVDDINYLHIIRKIEHVNIVHHIYELIVYHCSFFVIEYISKPMVKEQANKFAHHNRTCGAWTPNDDKSIKKI